MQRIYKVLLFSALSISFPIGKLFEIFIWNDKVIRSEIVSCRRYIKPGRGICFFAKVVLDMRKKFLSDIQNSTEYKIIELAVNRMSIILLSLQDQKVINYKILFIKQFIPYRLNEEVIDF